MTDYRKKYLKIQDLNLHFDVAQNVKVYVSSYFRSDKESNTTFLAPNSIEPYITQVQGAEIQIEMYNDTFIYMGPTDRNNNNLQFSFEIFQAAIF